MATSAAPDFLAGVIEGFYGQPWSQAERVELFGWMAGWGLNTYLYAPKDDLKHRATWRERYSAEEAGGLSALLQACQSRNLRFIYALSPGLDIRYSNAAEMDRLKDRLEQMLALGCRHFALLFDDLPDRMAAEDVTRFGSLALAQCQLVNAVCRWLGEQTPSARLLFCPTPYCGRMAERKLGGEQYLPTIGRELLPEIDVFWTGPEIVSQEITVSHVQELQKVLRRKPVIWDNLQANDYDGRRFYCGPYAGRSLGLRQEVTGLLLNPSTEFPLNYVPIRTLAAFLRCEKSWDARQAYLSAMKEWLPQFTTVSGPAALEELILLGDCYYLPHSEGPEAERFYECARELVNGDPATDRAQLAAFRQTAARLREFCARLAELRNRPLFYALNRRIWELREELDLLERWIAFKFEGTHRETCLSSDAHLPGTYRGGFVPRLQRLLTQQPDGTFAPTSREAQDAAGAGDRKRTAFSVS